MTNLPKGQLAAVYIAVIVGTLAAFFIGLHALAAPLDRALASRALADACYTRAAAANRVLGYSVGLGQTSLAGPRPQLALEMSDAIAAWRGLHDAAQPAHLDLSPAQDAQRQVLDAQVQSAYSLAVGVASEILFVRAPNGAVASDQTEQVQKVAAAEIAYATEELRLGSFYLDIATQENQSIRSRGIIFATVMVLIMVAGVWFFIAPAHRMLSRRIENAIRGQEQTKRIGSSVARDVANRDRRAAEAQFQTLFRDSSIGVALTDERGRILDSNPALQTIVGDPGSDVTGLPFDQWRVDGPSPSPQDTSRAVESRWRRADGKTVFVEERFSKVVGPDGRTLVNVGFVNDISDRKEAERLLQYDATHDSLTGLANRKTFLSAVTEADRNIRLSEHGRFAVLLIDLDRFKFVNDSRGHQFGDAVLAELGRRLEGWARPGDVVARFGGDEFTALVHGIDDAALATRLADDLGAGLGAPIFVGGVSIRISASIGICLWSEAVRSAEELVHAADVAAYRAKSNGRACSVVYDVDMATRDRLRTQIGAELPSALDSGQLRLAYQPILDLKTHRCNGFEALVRWSHPELGEISPAIFIPIAEESGLINAIGSFVMREAGRQLMEWRRRFPDMALQMNVNVSTQQFVHPHFLEELESVLSDYSLPGSAFSLELTETAVFDDARLGGDVLARLRAIGSPLVLDDFGTGYSSLSLLQSLPIDALKIDRQFVSGKGPALAAKPIVSALLALARSIDIDVVAEGVETKEQEAELAALGCRYTQGYLFSRPLDVAAADALLARSDMDRFSTDAKSA